MENDKFKEMDNNLAKELEELIFTEPDIKELDIKNKSKYRKSSGNYEQSGNDKAGK